MNFVRRGPRYLFVRTEKVEILENSLLQLLDGQMTECSDALERAEEGDTIVFITSADKKKTRIGDAEKIIFIPDIPSSIMADLISFDLTNIIHNVDLGPGQIVMRIPENGLSVIKEIQKSYKVEKVDLITGINKGEADDTVLTFSHRPIRNKINSLQLIEDNLLISKSINDVYQELRRDVIQYITRGLDHTEWYEVKINIYDIDNMYDINYERLVLALSDLEVGFILGESWTKDHVFTLFSIAAYQVRLFTILSPEEIKRILLSLEYDKTGSRIVDYDLYHNSEKVGWLKAVDEKIKGNRPEVALKLQQEIFSQFSNSTLEKLEELEERLKINED